MAPRQERFLRGQKKTCRWKKSTRPLSPPSHLSPTFLPPPHLPPALPFPLPGGGRNGSRRRFLGAKGEECTPSTSVGSLPQNLFPTLLGPSGEIRFFLCPIEFASFSYLLLLIPSGAPGRAVLTADVVTDTLPVSCVRRSFPFFLPFPTREILSRLFCPISPSIAWENGEAKAEEVGGDKDPKRQGLERVRPHPRAVVFLFSPLLSPKEGK